MQKQKLSRIVLGVCAVIVAIAGPLQLAQTVHADKYDDKIRAIQQQVSQYQASAQALRQQADTLQAVVSRLTAEKNALQAQLELNQAQFDKLTADIALNKQKIADNQSALGGILASLYVDATISPLEMLASSKNVSDYMDKQEYRTAVSERLNSTIEQVKTLKAQMEADQKALEKVLEEQKSHRATLAAKEAEQQSILDKTKGEEAAYQHHIGLAKGEMARIAAEQRAALARVTGGNNYGRVGSFQFRNFSGNQGACGGGYGWSPRENVNYCRGALDSMVDEWDLYSRECVSFAAWSAYYQHNKAVSSFSGRGNAGQWLYSAPDLMNATVNDSPAVGAVAILPATPGLAPVGHAMVVEAVLGGGWVQVSQYNFGGTGEFSTMDVHSSGVKFVHFLNR